jgi:hypothetical protein
MEVFMEIAFELGRFGDRRLEKGGRCCTVHWWQRQARAFAGWLDAGGARFSSIGFCAIGG